jgi:Dna[CI] antecedent, DciA
MRKNNDQSLSEVIGQFIQENKLKPQLNETRIKNLWETLMGKTIATYTSNISVRRGILYISILSAPLKQELAFSKEKIMTLLNDELGEDFIKEVVIR